MTWAARALFLALSPALLRSAAAEPPEDSEEAAAASALAADDECTAATGGASCALSALQLRQAKAGTRGGAANSWQKVPAGVNFGGWLLLEDWFFSGRNGHYVATPNNNGSGGCFPPLVPQLERPWPSEGVLGKRLVEAKGSKGAAEAFEAHRHSYISDSDFADLAEAGIRAIRVPLIWSVFADALAPIDQKVYASHDPEHDTVMVPDPFYVNETMFATVPRTWLVELLHKAERRGLEVVFDLHAFPGGSSHGTYNGIWPLRPAFWTKASTLNHSVALSDAGIWIAEAMVRWLEGLDSKAQKAVAGVTFMNEPAMMASPERVAGRPFANESDVLSWLEKTADLFRSSKLPERGVMLYVNIHESAFDDFYGTIVPWWHQKFTKDERYRWAVMDRHYYTAWLPDCKGETVPEKGFLCDDPLETVYTRLRNSCIGKWAHAFAESFEGLRACTEFSVGTNQDAWLACKDPELTQMFLRMQLHTFTRHRIVPFFWTWRMPYGQVYEPGWSLKHLLGMESPLIADACLPGFPLQ